MNIILRFKHNIFNYIFLLRQPVFYHHCDILNFLDAVEETKNNLLKAISLGLKEDMYAAVARSLGLVSKFLTNPLRILLETSRDEFAHWVCDEIPWISNWKSDSYTLIYSGENIPFDLPLN